MKANIKNKTGDNNLPKQYEQTSEMFFMWLLFENKPEKPGKDVLYNEVVRRFGHADIISSNEELTSFGVKKYMDKFKEGSMPAQIVIGNVQPFEQSCITSEERAQLRDIETPEAVLSKCRYRIFISDMIAALTPSQRAELLMDWLETAILLMPECTAVWIPSAGKLIPSEWIKNNIADREERFVSYCVNARVFNISESKDKIVDTHGMCALGFPDVQFHFHSLEPAHVINYVYNIAAFIFLSEQKIKDNDTIDGIDKNGMIDENEQWKCCYEDSMAQPMRAVVDICPGKYAGGDRN